MNKVKLDEVDHQILDILIDNTRVPFTDISKRLFISAGTVHVRVKKMEEAGIITNMNMLPGDTKALSPSGLRLGTPELTRVGMGTGEMREVARFFARSLIEGEDPSSVKADVRDFKSQFQTVKYCFEPGPAYPGL